MPTSVRKSIFTTDPYQDFDVTQYAFDDQGFGGKRPFLSDMFKLMNKNMPVLIFEIGTWLGQSAMTMAKAMKANGIKGEIVCIDTWLGSPELWLEKKAPKPNERYHKCLRISNGYPSFYYQFLANVRLSKLQDIITPLPQTSYNAAEMLAKIGKKADAIYIDGAHSYKPVFDDIEAFLPLASEKCLEKGLFFGDDYRRKQFGVTEAVNDVAKKHNYKVLNDDKDPSLWRYKA